MCLIMKEHELLHVLVSMVWFLGLVKTRNAFLKLPSIYMLSMGDPLTSLHLRSTWSGPKFSLSTQWNPYHADKNKVLLLPFGFKAASRRLVGFMYWNRYETVPQKPN